MLKEYILSDYKRCGIQKISIGALLYTFYIQPNPGLKFMTIFRLTQHYRRKNRMLFYFFFLWLRRLKVKYGFDISYRTQIGKGFYIGHFGNIVTPDLICLNFGICKRKTPHHLYYNCLIDYQIYL